MRWTSRVLVDSLELIDPRDGRFMEWLTGPGRKSALAAVRKRVAAGQLSPGALRNAGFILLWLGDPAGTDVLIDSLRSGHPTDWEQFLTRLTGGPWLLALERSTLDRVRLPIEVHKLEPVLLSCLSSPHEHWVRLATQVARKYPTPAVWQRVRELLQQEQPEVRIEAALALLSYQPCRESLEVAGAAYVNGPGRPGSQVFLQMAKDGPPELRDRARELLVEFVLRHLDLREVYLPHSLSHEVSTAFSALAALAHPRAEELLLRIHGGGGGRSLRGPAVFALARHFGRRHLKLALSALRDPELMPYGACAVTELKPATLPRWAPPLLVRHAAKTFSPESRDATIHLLLSLKTQSIRKHLEGMLDKVSGPLRTKLLWEIRGLTPSRVTARLERLKVIRKTNKAVLARIQSTWRKNRNPEAVLREILAGSGRVAAFDLEATSVPIEYSVPLEALAHGSAGLFVPKDIVQKSPAVPGAEHAPYEVSYRAGRKTHSFLARNRGDWYDDAAVVRSANAALGAAGHPERYFRLESGDQMAMYILADATAVQTAVQELALPLQAPANSGAGWRKSS